MVVFCFFAASDYALLSSLFIYTGTRWLIFLLRQTQNNCENTLVFSGKLFHGSFTDFH